MGRGRRKVSTKWSDVRFVFSHSKEPGGSRDVLGQSCTCLCSMGILSFPLLLFALLAHFGSAKLGVDVGKWTALLYLRAVG